MNNSPIIVSWRQAPGFEDYEVSDHGDVRRVGGRPLNPSLSSMGYRRVVLKGRQQFVHRLVASAFLGAPPDAWSEVGHVNGDREDNRASNLRWQSRQEGASRRRHGRAKLTPVQVKIIRDAGRTAMSKGEIARMNKVSVATITAILERRTWANI